VGGCKRPDLPRWSYLWCKKNSCSEYNSIYEQCVYTINGSKNTVQIILESLKIQLSSNKAVQNYM